MPSFSKYLSTSLVYNLVGSHKENVSWGGVGGGGGGGEGVCVCVCVGGGVVLEYENYLHDFV